MTWYAISREYGIKKQQGQNPFYGGHTTWASQQPVISTAFPLFLPEEGAARILQHLRVVWTTEVINMLHPLHKWWPKGQKIHFISVLLEIPLWSSHHTPTWGGQAAGPTEHSTSPPHPPQIKGQQPPWASPKTCTHAGNHRAHAQMSDQTNVTNLSQETSPLQGARFNRSDEHTAKVPVIERPRSKSREPRHWYNTDKNTFKTVKPANCGLPFKEPLDQHQAYSLRYRQ